MEDLSQSDQIKVATLLAMALPVEGMDKKALVRELMRPVGRAVGWLGQRVFGPSTRGVAPEVVGAGRAAATEAGGGAASSLGDIAFEYAPSGARAAAGEAAGAGAGAAAGAAGEAATSRLPGYLGRIQKTWQEMGTPGPWSKRHLGSLAGPVNKALQYMMFPVGPGLAAYHGLQGNTGPVATLANTIGPLATLPLGPRWWIPEMAFGIFGAPRVDEALGWKPRAQREAEMYASGAQQGARGMMEGMPPPSIAPQQSQVPPPGSFYPPTLAYTPMGQMQVEQAGRILRGEY